MVQPHTVSVRLDDLLESYINPRKNQKHIIYTKLADLVNDVPAKLVQENTQHNIVKYRFAPFLVDDTDEVSTTYIPTQQRQQQQENKANILLDAETESETSRTWVLPSGSTDNFISFDSEKSDDDVTTEEDLISFEKEEDNVLVPTFMNAEQQQQQPQHQQPQQQQQQQPVKGFTTTSYSTPVAYYSPQHNTYSSKGATTTVYHPPVSSHSPQRTSHTNVYSSSIKVPLFTPPPQHAQSPQPRLYQIGIMQPVSQSSFYQTPTKRPITIKPALDHNKNTSSPTTTASAPTADDTMNCIAEKLSKNALFKLPTKTVITIKAPADKGAKKKITSPSFNVNAVPFIPPTSIPSSPSSTTSSTFNANAAPFIPPTSIPSSPSFNANAAQFIPPTSNVNPTPITPTMDKASGNKSSISTSSSAVYNVNAVPFIPTTANSIDEELIPISTDNDDITTIGITLDELTAPIPAGTSNVGGASTNTSSPTTLNAKATSFTPGSKSSTDEATSPTPAVNNDNVEEDLISLNVMAMPFTPLSNNNNDDDIAPPMNPSAPVFQPLSASATGFSPSLSSSPLHSSSTSTSVSSTTDDMDCTHNPTSPKSDTLPTSTVATRLNSVGW
ncbi:unnamed protein product [Absidia cylindrospora]